MDPIEGISMFAAAAVVIYLLFPILGGVQTATTGIIPVPTNLSTQSIGASALYNETQKAGGTIAFGAGLISLETLIIAAVVLISTVLLIRRQKA